MKLKKILESIIDEEYPTSWNVEEFAKLTKFSERQKYCDEHLTKLTSGSGRIIYKIDNEKVLKLAKNTKGVAQCESEISLGADTYFDNLVAKVFESHQDGHWVEMQLATKCTPSKFKSIMGYSFDHYAQMLKHFYFTNVKPSRYGGFAPIDDEAAREIIIEDDFYNSMCELMQSYDMPAGDFSRINSYGIVLDGGSEKVVVVDYGLTNDVFDTHYSR